MLSLKELLPSLAFSVQQATLKAIKNYVQSFKIEARLEEISERVGVSIDPDKIAKKDQTRKK